MLKFLFNHFFHLFDSSICCIFAHIYIYSYIFKFHWTCHSFHIIISSFRLNNIYASMKLKAKQLSISCIQQNIQKDLMNVFFHLNQIFSHLIRRLIISLILIPYFSFAWFIYVIIWYEVSMNNLFTIFIYSPQKFSFKLKTFSYLIKNKKVSVGRKLNRFTCPKGNLFIIKFW